MKLGVCGGVAVAIAASVASAGNDWAFIFTTGDPDQIISFDLGNQLGSQTSLGFVDGNFNRGMDFDTYDSFYYYVSSNVLNDLGDRGLWYWNNGVNTQLATTGFDDGGDGDASLSRDRRTFYVTTDDGDGTAGDSLYAFSNLGGAVSFTEIGETGLSQLIGLAVHPVTGDIYGYDSVTEALYLISAIDGSATMVGASGITVGAIGGMDFNATGSMLLLSTAGDLWTIDVVTGLATAAGDVGLNVSALSYRVPSPGVLAVVGMSGLLAVRRRTRS